MTKGGKPRAKKKFGRNPPKGADYLAKGGTNQTDGAHHPEHPEARKARLRKIAEEGK